ncbi:MULTISPECIES: aminotransferase-like domain-containing protein [unclassified Rhizobium]|uniref:aminotransferase-like domain-containing protein n=1 Tax=unclassified Rhizobium TaxID=2613769 RepID=UPI001ADA4FFF|nr:MULTISPECIES: PLP-dependent aminotransferase family protein [unclassified Rhizobium]MBO9123731.1 PLP-dependent aminotransferase family protein [Rhizobium sp. 16-488-2b]MBO9174263.1 PLP-dependent aminotransferase family protein [Rhizobium sp. 16-488-2a]
MTATYWKPRLGSREGPIYLSIADALSEDIAAGRLAEGVRLPTQRRLAEDLGIDFTTVSRAYSEARSRGLIEGKVGQGTYVKFRRGERAPSGPSGVVDMSMNLPPRFSDPLLERRMWDGMSGIQGQGMDLLLRYQEPGGTIDDRAVANAWLSRRLPEASVARVLIAAGAQGALHAILSVLAEPGDTICAEELTYPGLRSIASHLRLRLAPVAMDAKGLVPEDFERVCRKAKPKALYCMPTLHNPTTRTMPLQRRLALIEVARKFGVPIVEDDAYGALAPSSCSPLAALAPEVVYHVASLSKCLSPALRVAYVAVPEGRAQRITHAIRASASIVSPLTSALASHWIETGVADAVREAICQENVKRHAAVVETFPFEFELAPGGFHLWLKVPEPWTRGELVSRLRSVGIGIVTSDAFAVTAAPEAVRLALGAPPSIEELKRGLMVLTDLLSQPPAMSTMVI